MKESFSSKERHFNQKMRKKTLQAVAVFAAASLSTASCAQDEDRKESVPSQMTKPLATAETVVLEPKIPYEKSRCGNTGEKVLLTFDDWTYAPTSAEAKSRLKEFVVALNGERTNNLPDHAPVGALFFPVKQYIAQDWPRAPRYLRKNNFYVGNHSWSHQDLADPDTNLNKEILQGVKSNLLRPPYGSYDNRVQRFTRNHDYKICTWTLDTKDWTGISAREIRKTVRREVEAGDVILMHLQPTSHALEAIQRGLIEDIEKKGLEVCTKPKEKAPRNIPHPIPECG